MSKIQVYCAVSIDGYIAGPDDDLSWLGASNPEQPGDSGTISFPAFMEQTGVMLIGRRTFNVVTDFGGDWPYGSTPVLVATTRPLPTDSPETVSACQGDIKQLCDQAMQAAGDKNVYLDGGNLITQAIESGCVHELVLTVVPVLLGQGVPLYSGKQMRQFSAEYLGQLGNMLQTRLTTLNTPFQK